MNGSLVHVRGTKLIDWNGSKKNWIELNSIQLFFEPSQIVSEHFFFHPMRFLAIGHVTRHMFKRCKQTRCQKNILFYLNFFCFCSIIFYSYAFVLFLLYLVENRAVPIRSVLNGYCILDQNGTVHWTESLKKTGVDICLYHHFYIRRMFSNLRT